MKGFGLATCSWMWLQKRCIEKGHHWEEVEKMMLGEGAPFGGGYQNDLWAEPSWGSSCREGAFYPDRSLGGLPTDPLRHWKKIPLRLLLPTKRGTYIT